MKRIIAIILTVTLLVGTFSILNIMNVSADAVDIVSNNYEWTGTTTVYASSKGARYFRTKVLSDGTVGAVYYRSGFGNYFAKSYDGGITFTDEVKLLPNMYDTEITDSPYVDSDHPYGRGRLEAQNPNLYEMPNGDIFAFHRYNTYTGEKTAKPWSRYYTSIQYQKSTDGGKSWTEPKVMVEYLIDTDTSNTSNFGLWEPDPYLINGKLFVYYADTYIPQDLSYQHISYCVYDEETETFSNPAIAQNGVEHGSRDGMSVVTELSDGNYAMVFESTKTANTDNTFVIKMSLSKDGRNWSRPVIVATPDIVLEQNAISGEKAVCCAPHIITLPDGRVAISYQTTDCYTGVVPDRVSYRVGTQVAVSNDVVTYDKYADIQNFNDLNSNANVSSEFSVIENGPSVLAENQISKSASLLYNNGYLMVYYNMGYNTDAYTHAITEVNVSYAKLGTKINYNNKSNYILYNKNNSEITEEKGVFTLPSSTSTMLVTDKNVENEIAVSYNASDYTLYSGGGYTATFNSANKTITTTNTGKALIKNTEDLNSFKASLDINGNTKTGAMQGGFAFHLDENDFNTNYFNTTGYSVFARRLTSDLSKVEIAYRYCVEGVSVYSYIAGTYKGLDENDLDMTFNLQVVVNENKFYAQLKDENGKVLINAKEAPLNETRDESAKYCPVGSLALITHGAHTLSNIKITKTTEIVKTDYLKARAVFNLSDSGDNQFGFAFRAQGSVNDSPGYSGYVVKLVKTDAYEDGKVVLQLTRYGTNSTGTKFKNLGNMKTYTDTTVLNGAHINDVPIILEAEIEGSTLTATLINYYDQSITSTYIFDLNTKSGSYTTYYADGGYGIFNHSSSSVTVSDIEFVTEKDSITNTLNEQDFTVYQPDDSTEFEYGSFVSTKASGKKIMLNDVITADFKSDATFAIGEDGTIKAGIIFRAGNLGNSVYDMESFAAVVEREKSGKNYGQFRFVIYKWSRTKTGKLYYFARMKYFNDSSILSSVVPDAKTSQLAGAGTKIKINLDVSGDNANVYFEVFDKDGNVGAVSDTLSYDLSTELTPPSSNFTYDSANTYYGAGQVGVWIKTKTRFCDFNIETKDSLDLADKLVTVNENERGSIYTTLYSRAAESGSLIKVLPVNNENYTLFGVKTTVNGTEKLVLKTDNEFKFTKENGATELYGIFGTVGDTNDDGQSDSADLIVLTKVLLNVEEKLETIAFSDINLDGKINVKDLVGLKNSLS